jgi:hypothetical protein
VLLRRRRPFLLLWLQTLSENASDNRAQALLLPAGDVTELIEFADSDAHAESAPQQADGQGADHPLSS